LPHSPGHPSYAGTTRTRPPRSPRAVRQLWCGHRWWLGCKGATRCGGGEGWRRQSGSGGQKCTKAAWHRKGCDSKLGGGEVLQQEERKGTVRRASMGEENTVGRCSGQPERTSGKGGGGWCSRRAPCEEKGGAGRKIWSGGSRCLLKVGAASSNLAHVARAGERGPDTTRAAAAGRQEPGSGSSDAPRGRMPARIGEGGG
jgi:hypothetical protein